MAGLNLSQPRDEAQQRKSWGFAGAGINIGIILLVLSGAVFGGLRWYIASLDTKIAAADAVLAANAGQISGDRVDRVADFDARAAFFSSRKNDLFDPRDILKELEGVMVPGVVLTEYKYDHDSKVSMIRGRADDFKKLAEQMLRLKSAEMFSRVTAKEIGRDDSNRVVFVLNASF